MLKHCLLVDACPLAGARAASPLRPTYTHPQVAKFGFEFGVDFSSEHSAKAVLGDKHVKMGRHVFFVPKDKVRVRSGG